MPLADELADVDSSESKSSAEPLPLHSLNLNYDPILDDHTDRSETDAGDGPPNVIQIGDTGRRRSKASIGMRQE